jgi:hypothetical protein
MIAAHNAGLQQLADSYNAAGVPTTIVDVDLLTREVHADLETFGLKAYDDPLYTFDQSDSLVRNEITSQFDPSEVGYFDSVHPSAAGHGIFAAFAEATLRADQIIFENEESANVVSGASGADFVVAGGGDDSALAVDGNDVVLAGLGNDTVDGGAGSDLVIGGSGNDVLNGSAGSDLLAGNAGDDIIQGGGDNDIVLLGTGHDWAAGDAGDDLLVVTGDALSGFDPIHDLVYGGTGQDTLRLEVSETVFASEFFQSEIHAFEPSAVTMDSIGLTAQEVERLEVYVNGIQEFAAGHTAVDQGTAAAALLRDAGLWGLV